VRGTFVGLGGWLKNSFIDYPGTVSTVLFFSGCNLRCPYCHNKILVNRTVDQSMLSEQIWAFLEARRGLIEGVVLSGGEPTLYPYLADVVREMRAMGLRVKLDTNGLLPDITETFAADYLALDVKTVPRLYAAALGATLDDIEGRLEKSVAMVRNMGENAEVRITVAPRIVDISIIRELRPLLAGVSKVMLQPMNQRTELLDPSFETLPLVPAEEIRQMRDILAESVGRCVVRDG